MNRKQKTELVTKLMTWFRSKGCSAIIRRWDKTDSKTCEVVELGKDDTPLNTICFESFPAETGDEDCWTGVMERYCSGKLMIEQFGKLGLDGASTLEELELKLEISGV